MAHNRNTTTNRGFTLIEAIVVAVIASVLAITAVMMYSGFIKESRQESVRMLAETGAAAANAYVRRTNTNLTCWDVGKLQLYYDATKYRVRIFPDNGLFTGRIIVDEITDATVTATANY